MILVLRMSNSCACKRQACLQSRSSALLECTPSCAVISGRMHGAVESPWTWIVTQILKVQIIARVRGRAFGKHSIVLEHKASMPLRLCRIAMLSAYQVPSLIMQLVTCYRSILALKASMLLRLCSIAMSLACRISWSTVRPVLWSFSVLAPGGLSAIETLQQSNAINLSRFLPDHATAAVALSCPCT